MSSQVTSSFVFALNTLSFALLLRLINVLDSDSHRSYAAWTLPSPRPTAVTRC